MIRRNERPTSRLMLLREPRQDRGTHVPHQKGARGLRDNALLTAMSLRLRVREPIIRTRIPKLRAWGLSLNGKRVRFLGFVEATNQEAAESTVVDELGLS